MKEEKPKLEICWACGAWQQDPRKFTQEQQDNYELVYCGCEDYEEPRYVTRDMAIDAGDLSLEGMQYNN